MTPLDDSTSAVRDYDSLHKQRRARSQLSCDPCRQGKLKCNRDHPACDQCIKRSREHSCTYLPPIPRTKPGQNYKKRITHLERLVVDFINSKDGQTGKTTSPWHGGRSDSSTNSSSPNEARTSVFGHSTAQLTPPTGPDSMVSIPEFETAPTTTSDAPSTGHLTAGAQESTYVGDSHWTSILGSISDLRRDLEDNETREDTDPNGWQIEHDEVLEDDPSQSSNLLKAPKRRTKKELIALLPARQEVDRLVSQWFNSSDPFKPMLHPPTFQAEYKRFWQNPDNAPTMWIGLLYSILSLAAAFDLRKSPDVSSPKARLAFATATEYHDMAASAAVLADYTTPKAYTIECLLLYTSGLRSKNAFVDVWILLGVIVRLAMRMGYHRDARHYSQLTPFQGEMRRRMWHALVMIEVLISFQIGLPSIVRTLQSDCQPPRNLLDSDLNVTMKELPPNRPFEELTPVSYSIAKVRITNVFAAAAELSHRTIPPAYTQMMELDQQIEVARSLVPTRLLGRPLDQCITDPPELIMASLNLDRLYLKTKVVLHRRFMRSTTATELGTPESRKICIDCSMRMLTQHHEVHEASQPGGQMEMVSWYMGTISTYDFLLAAAILCMELSQQGGDQTSSFQLEACDQTEMVKKLERSKAIWDETNRLRGSEDQPAVLHSAYQESIFVHDTEKAAKALGVMLAKINARYKATAVDSTVHAQAMRASSAGERANVEFGITGWTQDQSADLAALGDLFAIPEDIDWAMWDQQMNHQDVDMSDPMNLMDWSIDDVLAQG